jgi:hypothetical protein
MLWRIAASKRERCEASAQQRQSGHATRRILDDQIRVYPCKPRLSSLLIVARPCNRVAKRTQIFRIGTDSESVNQQFLPETVDFARLADSSSCGGAATSISHREVLAMKSLWTPGPVKVALLVLLTGFATTPKIVTAKSPVKLKKFTGAVDVLAEGPTPFVLSGTGSHLGQYEAYGEIEFGPGDEPGSLIGQGVAVFEAASGDLLVGVVTWNVDAGDGEFRTSHIHFAWRDFIAFEDGTIVVNTGRFVDDRPPGLVVIAIIAILIGLLVPAVQK